VILMTDILLGSRRSARCSDGKTRTGTVVYINPYHIFAVLQFDFWREAFFLKRPDRQPQQAPVELVEDTIDGRRGKHRRRFTPEDDAAILKSENTEQTAKKLHRSGQSVRNRRIFLRRRAS
jgi:hypothetical protein